MRAVETTANDICPRCQQPFVDGDVTAVVISGIGPDLEVGPYRIHLKCQRVGDELSDLD
jgi:hypothetical protein